MDLSKIQEYNERCCKEMRSHFDELFLSVAGREVKRKRRPIRRSPNFHYLAKVCDGSNSECTCKYNN